MAKSSAAVIDGLCEQAFQLLERLLHSQDFLLLSECDWETELQNITGSLSPALWLGLRERLESIPGLLVPGHSAQSVLRSNLAETASVEGRKERARDLYFEEPEAFAKNSILEIIWSNTKEDVDLSWCSEQAKKLYLDILAGTIQGFNSVSMRLLAVSKLLVRMGEADWLVHQGYASFELSERSQIAALIGSHYWNTESERVKALHHFEIALESVSNSRTDQDRRVINKSMLYGSEVRLLNVIQELVRAGVPELVDTALMRLGGKHSLQLGSAMRALAYLRAGRRDEARGQFEDILRPHTPSGAFEFKHTFKYLHDVGGAVEIFEAFSPDQKIRCAMDMADFSGGFDCLYTFIASELHSGDRDFAKKLFDIAISLRRKEKGLWTAPDSLVPLAFYFDFFSEAYELMLLVDERSRPWVIPPIVISAHKRGLHDQRDRYLELLRSIQLSDPRDQIALERARLRIFGFLELSREWDEQFKVTLRETKLLENLFDRTNSIRELAQHCASIKQYQKMEECLTLLEEVPADTHYDHAEMTKLHRLVETYFYCAFRIAEDEFPERILPNCYRLFRTDSSETRTGLHKPRLIN